MSVSTSESSDRESDDSSLDCRYSPRPGNFPITIAFFNIALSGDVVPFSAFAFLFCGGETSLLKHNTSQSSVRSLSSPSYGIVTNDLYFLLICTL